MKQFNAQTAAARLKFFPRLRSTLALVLGSGFHHVLTERPVKTLSFVAAEVTRLKFPWKQSFV
jgi:hypothetical protein